MIGEIEWYLWTRLAPDTRPSLMNAPFAQAIVTGARAFPRRQGVVIWWSAAAAVAIVLVIPFVLVDVPPVLDYPNHLARFFVLAHPDDPVLSQIYAPNWRILPNLGMDVIGALLLRVVDVHVGGRLLLALSLFAPVIGVVVYHRAVFARRSLWPLASALVAYNGVFFLGFMNFLLSLGLALCAAGGWIVLRRRQMVWAPIAFGAAAAAVTFICHIFGVLFFVLLIGADEVDRLWAARRSAVSFARGLAQVAMMIAAALSPALLLYGLSPLNLAEASYGGWMGWHKVWWILAPFMTSDARLTLITAVAVLSLLMLVRRQLRLAPGLPLALAILFVAFILVPQNMGTGALIDVRCAVMIGLLLFAGVAPELDDRQALFAGVAIGALILGRSLYIGSTWIDHRQDLAEVRAAIAAVEPGTRVILARGHAGDEPNMGPAERHLPGLYRMDNHLAALLVIERRAFWPLLFAHPAQQPLTVRPPYDALAMKVADPVPWAWLADTEPSATSLPAAPYLAHWRTSFDAVLLLDPAAAMPSVPGLSLIHAGSYAELYRIDHPSRTVQCCGAILPTPVRSGI